MRAADEGQKKKKNKNTKNKKRRLKGVPPETAQKKFFLQEMLKGLVKQLRPRMILSTREKKKKKGKRTKEKKKKKKKKKGEKRSAETKNHLRMYTFAKRILESRPRMCGFFSEASAFSGM